MIAEILANGIVAFNLLVTPPSHLPLVQRRSYLPFVWLIHHFLGVIWCLREAIPQSPKLRRKEWSMGRPSPA